MSDYRLSSREAEVASLVAQGYTYPQIAAKLGIRASTVRQHVLNIVEKIGNPDKLEPRIRVLLAHRAA